MDIEEGIQTHEDNLEKIRTRVDELEKRIEDIKAARESDEVYKERMLKQYREKFAGVK